LNSSPSARQTNGPCRQTFTPACAMSPPGNPSSLCLNLRKTRYPSRSDIGGRRGISEDDEITVFEGALATEFGDLSELISRRYAAAAQSEGCLGLEIVEVFGRFYFGGFGDGGNKFFPVVLGFLEEGRDAFSLVLG